MAIDRLQELIPPPQTPTCTSTAGDWLKIKSELGLDFPKELKEFCAVYGMGTFRGSETTAFSIYCPWRGFVDDMRRENQRLREIRSPVKSEDYPFDVFPEEGGLLPLGSDECDAWLCWATKGLPDTWPIVVRWTWGLNGMQSFDLSLSEFLVSILKRKIELPCWPLPWFVDDVRFVPYEGPL
jgi:SMI1-KNR4 cell-wall